MELFIPRTIVALGPWKNAGKLMRIQVHKIIVGLGTLFIKQLNQLDCQDMMFLFYATF